MTSSTYKSFGGPAGGFVVTNEEEIAENLVSTITYPGLSANFNNAKTAALAVTCADLLDFGTRLGHPLRFGRSLLIVDACRSRLREAVHRERSTASVRASHSRRTCPLLAIGFAYSGRSSSARRCPPVLELHRFRPARHHVSSGGHSGAERRGCLTHVSGRC